MSHYIWNSSLVMAKQIENNIINVKGKRILELGAGAGLPSLISCLNNAKEVNFVYFIFFKLFLLIVIVIIINII